MSRFLSFSTIRAAITIEAKLSARFSTSPVAHNKHSSTELTDHGATNETPSKKPTASTASTAIDSNLAAAKHGMTTSLDLIPELIEWERVNQVNYNDPYPAKAAIQKALAAAGEDDSGKTKA